VTDTDIKGADMQKRQLIKVVSGRVVGAFGPFRARAKVAHYSDGTEMELPLFAITLTSPSCDGGETPEEMITSLHGRQFEVARAVQCLRDWLRESEGVSRRLAQAQEELTASSDSDESQERLWLAHLPEGLDRARCTRERVMRALQTWETEHPDTAHRDVGDA
jgi:hypothetical protein